MNPLSKGVIYYNIGYGAIVRLAVSISSLRKVYAGDVTILADDPGYVECEKIAKHFNCNIKRSGLPTKGQNFTYLNKCLYHKSTPYDVSIAIDNDTLILKPFNDLFVYVEQFEFVVCQFCNWLTTGRRIGGRIREWTKYLPEYINGAINSQHAINCGVIGFTKGSKLMDKWYGLASRGKEIRIPDETCCQTILHAFPHYLAETIYNTSCKYGEVHEYTRIIHYHGRKHCRLDENNKPIFHADKWYKEFNTVKELPFVKDNIKHDRQLRHFIKRVK